MTAVAAGSITMDVDENYPHNFAGVIYFNDANGDTPVTPSGGNVTFDIVTVNQPQDFQDITGGTIPATSANQVDWDGNSLQVRVTFDTVTGATHARIVYTGNQS